MSPGYTDPLLHAAGGTPYGTSYASGQDAGAIPDETRAAARHQGARPARYARVIAEARATAGAV